MQALADALSAAIRDTPVPLDGMGEVRAESEKIGIAKPAEQPTIAVLPFADMSRDAVTNTFPTGSRKRF